MEHVTLGIANSTFPGETEIAGREEEHNQLPPYENVPEGCRAPEEGWQAWLNKLFFVRLPPGTHGYTTIVLGLLDCEEGNVLFPEFGFPFFTVYQKVML